jgi:hypothetical protein
MLTAIAVIVAFALPGSGWRGAAGVAGGALLIGASYLVIRRSVAGIVAAAIEPGAAPRQRWRAAAAFIVRYALLAGIAYVMIARLRLPAIGLLTGASVMIGSVAFELARRGSHPRV